MIQYVNKIEGDRHRQTDRLRELQTDTETETKMEPHKHRDREKGSGRERKRDRKEKERKKEREQERVIIVIKVWLNKTNCSRHRIFRINSQVLFIRTIGRVWTKSTKKLPRTTKTVLGSNEEQEKNQRMPSVTNCERQRRNKERIP